MTAAFVAAVIAPLLFWGLRCEVGRWYEAAYWNARYAGDLRLAMEDLDQAIAHCPNRRDLLVQRAELSMRFGDYDSALALADQLVGEARRLQQMKPGETWLRHQLALQLNNRAYYRAVANRENAAGLVDIQEAFELIGDELDPGMRDTRGYVSYRLGDYESAIVDLDYALPLVKGPILVELARLPQLERSGGTAAADRLKMDYERRRLREQLGVIYQHRGLILERLDRKKAARRDLESARQYGYDEEKGSL